NPIHPASLEALHEVLAHEPPLTWHGVAAALRAAPGGSVPRRGTAHGEKQRRLRNKTLWPRVARPDRLPRPPDCGHDRSGKPAFGASETAAPADRPASSRGFGSWRR